QGRAGELEAEKFVAKDLRHLTRRAVAKVTFVRLYDDQLRCKFCRDPREFGDVGIFAVAGVPEQHSQPPVAAQTVGYPKKPAQAVRVVRIVDQYTGSAIVEAHHAARVVGDVAAQLCE